MKTGLRFTMLGLTFIFVMVGIAGAQQLLLAGSDNTEVCRTAAGCRRYISH